MRSLDWLCPFVPPHPHSAGPGRRAALESWVNKGMTAGWFCTHQAVFQRKLDSSALQSHLQPPHSTGVGCSLPPNKSPPSRMSGYSGVAAHHPIPSPAQIKLNLNLGLCHQITRLQNIVIQKVIASSWSSRPERESSWPEVMTP